MRVIVTRSEPGGTEFSARLRDLGYDALCTPLLKAEPTHFPAPENTHMQGIIVTSTHALDYAPDHLKALPLYAVGAATAKQAKDRGWQNVITGTGDVRGLVPVLPAAPLLHLAGEDLAPGTLDALATLNVTAWPVYRTVPTGRETGIFKAPGKTVITLHSPRAAAILSAYVQTYLSRMQMGEIIFLCLSPAVLESLHTSAIQGMYVAGAPTEDAMVAALGRLI